MATVNNLIDKIMKIDFASCFMDNSVVFQKAECHFEINVDQFFSYSKTETFSTLIMFCFLFVYLTIRVGKRFMCI